MRDPTSFQPRAGASSRALVLVLVLVLAAAGCVPSLADNPAREPQRETPASFGAKTEGPPAGASLASSAWSEIFTSPELRALVEQALRGNRELSIQMQELVIASNEVSARQGEVLPRASAFAGAGVERSSSYTSQGRSDEATGLPENLGNFTFGLKATWEVDVWRKLRNATDAARLRYLATVEARHFLQTQLVAELARSYYELVAVDAELEVVRRNIDVQASALEVMKVEKLAARTTELAVQRFQAEVLKNRSRVYDLEQERVQAENRINFLVGRYPQPVARSMGDFHAALPAELRTGLPSDLLGNRPDVRRAELELAAAKLDVKSAKASFYPSLSIDAGLGYRAFNAEHLVTTPGALFAGLAGNLTAPLLNRRAIEAQYRSANARQIQAVLGYERVVLQGFTDVANQLAVIENLRKAAELQEQQVETLSRSVEVSTMLFQSARADYMEVLLTRRDSLEAQVSLLETKRRQWMALMSLYQALGGGWR